LNNNYIGLLLRESKAATLEYFLLIAAKPEPVSVRW